MNLSETQKQQIIQAIITAVITLVLAIASILGYNLGIKPAMDAQSAGTIGAQGLQPTRFQAVRVDNTLTVGGASTFTGAQTFTGASTFSGGLSVGAATITTGTLSTLVLGNQTQSGAVRFGAASVYTTGTSIAHGFTTTPTVCFISPSPEITATYTITTTGFSSNMATRANPVYWMCGK